MASLNLFSSKIGNVLLVEEEEIQCHADRYSSSMQWSFEMDGYFMDLMLEAVGKVKKFDYNDDLMWTSMISSFKERFGLVFNQDSFRRHFKSLEKKYYDLKNILKQRGFWWDERRHLVIAYGDTWAAYIKVSFFLSASSPSIPINTV